VAAATDESHPLTERVRFRLTNRDFRARAHSNPLNDGNFDVPARPSDVDWSTAFPEQTHRAKLTPDWVDIGCGYGGLLANMSPKFPDKLMIGLEIRDRVEQFCEERTKQLRQEFPGSYNNIWFLRTNVMKFLVHYFEKASVEKMFFCYPDPHFKKKKHRQRIISAQLLAEYAYVLKPQALVYVVTDVEELFNWMVPRFEDHPLFERQSKEKTENDPVTTFVRDQTDEAARVVKNKGNKYYAVFRRVENPPVR